MGSDSNGGGGHRIRWWKEQSREAPVGGHSGRDVPAKRKIGPRGGNCCGGGGGSSRAMGSITDGHGGEGVSPRGGGVEQTARGQVTKADFVGRSGPAWGLLGRRQECGAISGYNTGHSVIKLFETTLGWTKSDEDAAQIAIDPIGFGATAD
ncbi:hypothetical protein B0H19DRAFT_1073808 [Mycena capillaripes]|nr:hypothetical protein B0H19DRAFT_1073808 [Mycena capillaripes]